MSELYLTGLLDAQASRVFLKQLAFFISHEIKNIQINIDTPGGFHEPVTQICEAIKNAQKMGVSVRGVVVNECSSLGILVLQSCSLRLASNLESRIAFHLNSFEIKVTTKTSEQDLLDIYRRMFRKLKVSQELFCTIIERRTLQNPETIKSWIASEKVFDPQEACTVNLIDGIMSELVDAF